MKEQNREKEFESLLKQKSEGFELKPSGEVWEQIESSLKRDRRRGIFWWSIAAVFMATVATGTYFILQNESSHSKASSTEQTTVSNTENENSSAHDLNSDNLQYSAEKNSSVSNEKRSDENSASATVPFLSQRKNNHPKQEKKTTSSNAKQSFLLTTNLQREEDNIQKLSWEKSLLRTKDEVKGPTVKLEENHLNVISALSNNEASKHFSIEADAMSLATYSWNQQSSGAAMLSTDLSNNNSFWNAKGFSAGANFLFYPNKGWFIGTGIHFTSTHTELDYLKQTVTQYDTTYAGTTSIDTLVNVTYSEYQPKEKYSQQWLDFSAFAGLELFPDSKNHLRMIGGAAYSHLISVQSDYEIAGDVSSLDVSISGGAGTNNAPPTFDPMSFKKNQLQLFSEVAYVRDFGSALSISAGGQFHYYPSNLFANESISQHMITLGLKVGVQYNF